jgi:hypothetical protein
MYSSGKYAAARFRRPEPQPSYCKNALTAIGYAVGSAIVALCIWPASAGNIVAKFNAPAFVTFTSDLSNQIPKENRLTRISFQDKWSAVPASVTEPARKNSRHEPREGGIEKIPFSCELAFSRLIRQGNFSTRCVASSGSQKCWPTKACLGGFFGRRT